MKKIISLIICIGFNIFLACGIKGAREEEAYNPYDTSEPIEKFDVIGDTIYKRDSIGSVKLHLPDSIISNGPR